MNDGPLARLLVPLLRWWWVMAGAVALTAIVTVVTMPDSSDPAGEGSDVARDFQATHLLIRNEEAPAQLSFDLIQLLAGQGDLTNRIALAAGEDISVEDVQQVVFITNGDTGTVSITAIQPTAERAATLATTYADQLVTFLDERSRSAAQADYRNVVEQLELIESDLTSTDEELAELAETSPDRALLEAERESLLTDYADLRSRERALENQLAGSARSFETLEVPSPVPAFDPEDEGVVSALRLPGRLGLRVALLSFAALIAGVVVVFAIDFLDTRLRSRRQVEDAFGLPVLAELPKRAKRHLKADPLPAHNDPGGITAEVLRALRLSLSLAPTWELTSLVRGGEDGAIGAKRPIHLDDDPRSLVVTSPLTGDGKSTLVANLAVSLAEGGKRVLVVDCDFRRPAVGEILQINDGPGIRELAYADERPILDLATPTIARNVAMVRSGTRGVTPPWFMAQARQLVERCTDLADVVIFDTGPISLTNEASALLPFVDTSLVVVRAGKTAPDQARSVIEQFTQVSACVSGVVLVGAERSRRYGYGYYGPEGRRGAKLEAASATTRSPASSGQDELWEAQAPADGEDEPDVSQADPADESVYGMSASDEAGVVNDAGPESQRSRVEGFRSPRSTR